MREEYGDLWTHPANVKVITTNGDINARGQAVMGRGVALQAKTLIPGLEYLLAESIQRQGNTVSVLAQQARLDGSVLTIVSFPVKHHWRESADMSLIRLSAAQLAMWAEINEWPEVALPRPGCGNGSLEWKDVRPMLYPMLNDRFVVVERAT